MSRELDSDFKRRRGITGAETRPYVLWEQFLENNPDKVITREEFKAFNIKRARYTTHHNKKKINHPAFTSHIRNLVTYRTTNHTEKGCKYGQYRDGTTVKCIRNHSHHKIRPADHPDTSKQHNKYTKAKAAKARPVIQKQPIVRASNLKPPTQKKAKPLIGEYQAGERRSTRILKA